MSSASNPKDIHSLPNELLRIILDLTIQDADGDHWAELTFMRCSAAIRLSRVNRRFFHVILQKIEQERERQAHKAEECRRRIDQLGDGSSIDKTSFLVEEVRAFRFSRELRIVAWRLRQIIEGRG